MFSQLFFSFVVSKNMLTLLQNLAMVMRQRQSTLMAKPTDLSRLDKVLRESQGLPSLSLIQTSFIMITILWQCLKRLLLLTGFYEKVLREPKVKIQQSPRRSHQKCQLLVAQLENRIIFIKSGVIQSFNVVSNFY